MHPPALGLNLKASSGLRRGNVQVRTTLMQVRHIPRGGPITTNRVDMAIGGGGGDSKSALRLSLWGTHEPSTGAIDMVVGLPPGLLGLRDELLPDGYIFPVAMRGNIDRPRIDFKAAARRLGRLHLRQEHFASVASAAASEQPQRASEKSGLKEPVPPSAAASARKAEPEQHLQTGTSEETGPLQQARGESRGPVPPSASAAGASGSFSAAGRELFGRMLGRAVAAWVLPEVADAEAELQQDMAKIPKHWDLPSPNVPF